MMKQYEVRDKKGEIIFTGSADEIGNEFGTTGSAIRTNAHYTAMGIDTWYKGKYKIYHIGKKTKSGIQKPKKEEETPFSIAVWALKRYGNTSVDFDPYPKLLPDMLEIHGLDCKASERKEYPSRKITRRGKPKIHWYVEVARAIETSKSI